MTAFLAYIFARLKEPSSYAGLAALLALVGVHLAPESMNAIITAVTAVFGALAFFIPDINKPSA